MIPARVTLATTASRWVREGPVARVVPWRVHFALERAAPLAFDQGAPVRIQFSEEPPLATLLFGGDLALHRWTPDWNLDEVFGRLAQLTRSADGCVVNLETQLTTHTTPRGTIGSSLRAPPECIQVLRTLGLTAVTCANNHSLDFGSASLAESADLLGHAGIGVIGVQSRQRGVAGSFVHSVRGLQFGLLGYTDHWRVSAEEEDDSCPAPHDPGSVRADIRALAGQVDVVIVQLHWGYEWSMYPMRSLRDLARSYVDAGASLVVCHHAHVPLGIEAWHGGAIAHGLGNLYFGRSRQRSHPFRDSSFLLRAGFSRRGVVDVEITPVETSEAGSVGPSPEPQRTRLLGAIQYLSARLGRDAYLDQVEQSLELNHAGLILLDLTTRHSASDRSWIVERSRDLTVPRHRILVRNLLDHPGLPREMGLVLERLRERPAEFEGSGVKGELDRLGQRVKRLLGRGHLKGRVP